MTYRLVFTEPGTNSAAAATVMVSSNQLNKAGSYRWARAELTNFWRPLAFLKARNARIPLLDTVDVKILLRFPNNQVRDSHNYSPVLKAILDGVTAAGVIRGDDDRYVRSVTYERWWPNGRHAVALELTEVQPSAKT